MASADGPSPSPDRRGLLRLLRLCKPPASSTDQNPLISSSSPPPLPATFPRGKKKTFSSASFRGLGCTSSAASQAYVPASAAATVRSSADWEGKRPRRRRTKHKKRERRGLPSPSPAAVDAADVWCVPGMSLVGGDSVDCVVSHREMVGRGSRHEAERILSERAYSVRRAGNQEQISSISDSISSLQSTLFGSEVMPSEHYHHMRGYYNRPPVQLEEIMLFHHRLMLRGNAYDRHRDWRLDVDNMTYEELLELGDKIGYVSTGLKEEEIACIIQKAKSSTFDICFSSEMERKCSICQEEYDMEDEVGKLGCGHRFHICCIKKWLLQKNACPVCKTAVNYLHMARRGRGRPFLEHHPVQDTATPDVVTTER